MGTLFKRPEQVKQRNTRTINLRLPIWQRLHILYAQRNNRSLSDAIDALINENIMLRQKIAELEQGIIIKQNILEVEA